MSDHTLSDSDTTTTRTLEVAGAMITELLQRAGHLVAGSVGLGGESDHGNVPDSSQQFANFLRAGVGKSIHDIHSARVP